MKAKADQDSKREKKILPHKTLPTKGGGKAEFEDKRAATTVQRKLQAGMVDQSEASRDVVPVQRSERGTNNTGLPDNLKTGIENLSGHSMDDVKVHFNSSKPAQLQAHAFAKGTDIHLAPGQEKHLPHEAWHVVQQKQGRVKPTRQLKSKVHINDDAGLEKEADVMGAKAIGANTVQGIAQFKKDASPSKNATVVQRIPVDRPGWVQIADNMWKSKKEPHPGWDWILEDKGGRLLMRLELQKDAERWVDKSNMEFLLKYGEKTYEEWQSIYEAKFVLKDVINPNVDGAGPDTTHPHAGLAHWQDVATRYQQGQGLDALQDEMWGGGATSVAGDRFSVRPLGTDIGKRARLGQIHPDLEALIAVPALMIDNILFEEFLEYAKSIVQRKTFREGLPNPAIDPWEILRAFDRTKPRLIVYRAVVLDRGLVGARPTPRTYGKLLSARCAQGGATCDCCQHPGTMELELSAHVRNTSTGPRRFQSVTTIKSQAIAIGNTQLRKLRNRNNKVIVLFTISMSFLNMVYYGNVNEATFKNSLVHWGKGTKHNQVEEYSRRTEMILMGNIPSEDIINIELINSDNEYGVVEEDGNKF